MNLRVQEIRSMEDLYSIEDIWTELQNREDGPSIFQSWVWNRIWCEKVLSVQKRARLDVKIVEDGAGRPLAILPFFEETLPGNCARLTQFLGHKMSFHNDILLSEPGNPDLAGFVVDAMISSLTSWTVLHLRHLNEDSSFTRNLLARNLAEPQCTRLLVVADPNIKDQSTRLGKKGRKNFRKRKNDLAQLYNIEFCIRNAENFESAFDEMVSLHQRRFASVNRNTLLVEENLSFLKSATSVLSNAGIFEIVELCANGRTIASALRARDKRVYFAVQTGFDPDFSKFSPLRILISETIRRGFEDLECEIYDFGPGYEAHKFDWSPVIRTNYFCCIGGPGIYAKSLACLYRIAFKRRLPVAPMRENREHGPGDRMDH